MIKKQSLTYLLICWLLSFWAQPIFSKVDPPNYDFSLDSFAPFMPGKTLSELNKLYSQNTKMEDADGGVIYRFYVEQLRYRFPVFVLVKGDIIDNFYATLPSYFLHDVFHQSIINRYGMQQTYKKVEESAVYIWNNVNGNSHVYGGTCTITCFPLYYAVFPVGSTSTLLKKFSDHSNFGKEPKQSPKAEEALAL